MSLLSSGYVTTLGNITRFEIGVVPISAETDTALQVLAQANLACYTAKDLGRNRIHVYHAEDLELIRMESQMTLVSKLQAARTCLNALQSDNLIVEQS